jgi:hypothetical protein
MARDVPAGAGDGVIIEHSLGRASCIDRLNGLKADLA